MEMDKSKGFVPIVALIVVIVVVVVASAGSYYILRNQGKSPFSTTTRRITETQGIPSASPAAVSSSDDLDTIEQELKDTILGSPEGDFSGLDSSASSL